MSEEMTIAELIELLSKRDPEEVVNVEQDDRDITITLPLFDRDEYID